tara:strand:- start:25 stop:438 length:414 start_codon:yes stop_codon:yes gene_type:complete
MRAVVDTNVFVSGLIRPLGAPGKVLRSLRDRRFRAVVSEPILEELVATLARSWLQDRYGVSDSDVQDFLRLLALRSDLVEPRRHLQVCRDPHDDIFLDAAIEGGARRLVTGDADLLALGEYEDVRVMTPAAFMVEVD